jgi:hypothetical protein
MAGPRVNSVGFLGLAAASTARDSSHARARCVLGKQCPSVVLFRVKAADFVVLV